MRCFDSPPKVAGGVWGVVEHEEGKDDLVAEALVAALPIAPVGAAVAVVDEVPLLIDVADDEGEGWETVEESSQDEWMFCVFNLFLSTSQKK